MGFHPSKARLPGQFLVLDPSILRGALHFKVFATRDVAMARRLLAEKATTRAAELAAARSTST
jgi:hypothetical protein